MNFKYSSKWIFSRCSENSNNFKIDDEVILGDEFPVCRWGFWKNFRRVCKQNNSKRKKKFRKLKKMILFQLENCPKIHKNIYIKITLRK